MGHQHKSPQLKVIGLSMINMMDKQWLELLNPFGMVLLGKNLVILVIWGHSHIKIVLVVQQLLQYQKHDNENQCFYWTNHKD